MPEAASHRRVPFAGARLFTVPSMRRTTSPASLAARAPVRSSDCQRISPVAGSRALTTPARVIANSRRPSVASEPSTKSPSGVVQMALSGKTGGAAGGRTPPQPLVVNDNQKMVAAAPEHLKARALYHPRQLGPWLSARVGIIPAHREVHGTRDGPDP